MGKLKKKSNKDKKLWLKLLLQLKPNKHQNKMKIGEVKLQIGPMNPHPEWVELLDQHLLPPVVPNSKLTKIGRLNQEFLNHPTGLQKLLLQLVELLHNGVDHPTGIKKYL